MKPKPKEDETVLFIRDVPCSLKAAFKAHCAARELTMREVIIEMMQLRINPKPEYGEPSTWTAR